MQGVTDEGYSAISVLRSDNCEVYNNYIHDVDAGGAGSTIIRSRGGNDNKFYNNVIWVVSGDNCKNVFQWRADSGLGESAHRNEYYNNTVIMDGNMNESVFLIYGSSNNANDNKIFNNLYIGSASLYVGAWAKSGTQSNEFRNNYVTGTVKDWFESTAVRDCFDVRENYDDRKGTSFLTLSGNKPSPYWSLDQKPTFHGYSAGAPLTDYDGNPRGSIPDVGAFEYDTMPPSPPTVLRIVK